MWTISALIFILAIGCAVFGLLPSSRMKIVPTALFLALASVAFIGGAEILGRPKPATLEWRKLVGAQITGLWVVEDVAIYVMLVGEGDTPRLYVFPYSASDAESLQDTVRRMGEQGGTTNAGDGMDGVEGGAFTDDRPPLPLPPKQ